MIGLQNVLKTSLQDVFKTSWRRLEDAWRCLEDVLAKRLENVLKTCNYGEYIRLDQDVLKTKTKDVFIKTNVCWVTAWSSQTRGFPSFYRNVLNAFSKICKNVLEKHVHHFWKTEVIKTKSYFVNKEISAYHCYEKWKKVISQVSMKST